MSTAQQSVFVGTEFAKSGAVINVYSSYAYALAHAATGLSSINEVTELDGTEGDAITQTAKTVGVAVDQNGFAHFYCTTGTELFLIGQGQFGLPRRIYPQ